MRRVITFSRTYPAGHPRKGEPTFFVEKIWESIYLDNAGWEGFWPLVNSGNGFDIGFQGKYQPKHHTIRSGHRWKVGDKFSPRVWSGKPYQSKQIIIAPDIEVKKVWDVEIEGYMLHVNKENISWVKEAEFAKAIAKNDGLELQDFWDWFPYKTAQRFNGQIICWDDNINY